MKVLSIFGTRPEAIKMAPVVKELERHDVIESFVCVTGQHRQMLDQMLSFFNIKADFDLDLMESNQTLSSISQKTIARLDPIIQQVKPDYILVQGDTTTAMISALAAFYHKIPVAHIEAGLRTYNTYSPWPEEMNRQITARIASLHFAPTEQAKKNLTQEATLKESVFTVGNTVIDALLNVVHRLKYDQHLSSDMRALFTPINFNKRIILVTGHRRENWGDGLNNMCLALAQLAGRDDVEIVYPVHLNPIVQQSAHAILSSYDNVHLIPPLDYLPFVYLLSKCYLVITDSGGVQEEAPSLGKPILVTRDTTERPEGIATGTAKLIGTDTKALIQATNHLLDNSNAYQLMSSACNPYGDGKAAQRIVEQLIKTHQATHPIIQNTIMV
ncbi:MAG: UDP-N-acetylglucosamine 2-epimerase (non-hydrolyzing) [Coxiellaceae bacterium]|nr:UDP-N-acetylglucosamine 2-epimerase (non-hydrolyzing) [Coxiellaceae bacterium]